jgi:hypothetical protein
VVAGLFKKIKRVKVRIILDEATKPYGEAASNLRKMYETTESENILQFRPSQLAIRCPKTVLTFDPSEQQKTN